MEEVEILDKISSSGNVNGLLNPEEYRLALLMEPNSLCVKDLPWDAKLGLLKDSDLLPPSRLSTSRIGSRSRPKLLSLEFLVKSMLESGAQDGLKSCNSLDMLLLVTCLPADLPLSESPDLYDLR